MSRCLLDVNTVLALLDPRHVFHDAAHAWVERTPGLRWLTCPLVQNGVVRVASQTAYPNRLGTVTDVLEVLRAFCADPRHEFCPDDISLVAPASVARPELLTPSRVNDLYLLLLARQHSAKLATFDHRIPAEAIPEGARHLEILLA
ncbi:MAG: TA system VapC family ribonuclease toxin [Terrimicrobiaceae bacterium]